MKNIDEILAMAQNVQTELEKAQANLDTIEVEGASGGNPTVQESVKRNIWIAFGLAGIIPILGLVGSLASLVAVILIAVGISNDSATRRPCTDTFAGTRVVKEAGA